MSLYGQVKVGPELLNPSRESWLGYYVFAAATLVFLGGGHFWLRHSGLQGGEYCLGLLGVLILSLVSLGITIMCHLMGHLIDMVDDLKKQIVKTE